MPRSNSAWLVGQVAVLAIVSLIVAGCGKKDAEPEAAASKPAAAAAAPAAESAQGAGESTTDTFVVDATQQVTPADYDAAVKNKDYLRAADAVLRMNAQGNAGANSVSRMHELQDEVARAAANGDPKAAQAAAMLRRLGRMPSQAPAN